MEDTQAAKSGWELLFQEQESIMSAEMGGLVYLLEWIAAAVDVLSILVMLLGAARFLFGVFRAEFSPGRRRVYVLNTERMELGRYILAGLELLIVSDIIHTAISLALRDLVFLGLLVIIRSTISYFLDREIKDIREEIAHDTE